MKQIFISEALMYVRYSYKPLDARKHTHELCRKRKVRLAFYERKKM